MQEGKEKKGRVNDAVHPASVVTAEEHQMKEGRKLQKMHEELQVQYVSPENDEVLLPKNTKEMKNFGNQVVNKEEMIRDPLYNVYTLANFLTYEEEQPFIQQYTLPRLVLPLFCQPLLDEMQSMVNIAHMQLTELYYNTFFKMGDFFLSTLCFKHTMMNDIDGKAPIIPVAFLIHEGHLKADHDDFLSSVRKSRPGLMNGRFAFITDAEFDFDQQWQNASHHVCWAHIVKAFKHDLKSRHAVSSIVPYVKDLKEMMERETLSEFDTLWEKKKREGRYTRGKGERYVADYLERSIVPLFKRRTSKWVLRQFGITVVDGAFGVTSCPSESINSVLRRLASGSAVDMDVAVVCLYYLCNYYHREITRAYHSQGSFHLKKSFAAHLVDDDSKLDLPWCPPLEDLVDYVLRGDVLMGRNAAEIAGVLSGYGAVSTSANSG